MVRLDHPTITSVHVDVPKGDVKRWERSGWVKPATTKDVPAPVSDETTPAPPDAANEKE